MPYRVEMIVTFIDDERNPDSRKKRDDMKEAGYSVGSVRAGKYFTWITTRQTREDAEMEANELGSKVLSNPVYETFQIAAIKETEHARG